MQRRDGFDGVDMYLAARELADGRSVSELLSLLADFFAHYGEIQRVISLDGGKEPLFLVDFAAEQHAMAAANSSGFPLFGFKSLIVDLRQESSI